MQHLLIPPFGFANVDPLLALYYFWSINTGTVNSLQFFIPWANNDQADGIERFIVAPSAAVIKRIVVDGLAPGTGAVTTTYTLRVNGVPTALTVALLNTANPYHAEATGTIVIAPGDRISVSKQHSAAATTAAQRIQVRLEGSL